MKPRDRNWLAALRVLDRRAVVLLTRFHGACAMPDSDLRMDAVGRTERELLENDARRLGAARMAYGAAVEIPRGAPVFKGPKSVHRYARAARRFRASPEADGADDDPAPPGDAA